jgi:protein-S-isoprenylcysteine O-methyltransferase Ste14
MVSTENPVSENSSDPLEKPFLVRRRTVFTWLIPLLLWGLAMFFHKNFGGWSAYIAGIALVALGEVVRFWSNGYISKDVEIATGGPYAHVRNPLYFGSLLLAIGYGLISGLGIWGVLLMVGLYLVFHLAAIFHEEKFLTAKFGAPYLDYVNRVPRLLPSPWPRTQGTGQFEWAQALRNREQTSALFALIFVLLLSLRFFVPK